MDQLSTVQLIAIWILPILFAVTLHEAAHGLVAYKLGDNTAYLQGRITLNPVKHIDPLGTVVLPIILLLTTHFVFGWAKPVPVTQSHLRHPRRDMPLVALAGPLANFIMALFWVLILKLGIAMTQGHMSGGLYCIYVGQAGVMINVVLMVLNLLPIPPLDGSRVVASLLPVRMAYYYDRAAPVGILIILALAVTGILGQFLMAPINVVQRFLIHLVI